MDSKVYSQGLCVYPGSFDPITQGHFDIIHRASLIFPKVVVAVLHNSAKKSWFTVAKRMDMISRACATLPQVEVDSFSGLLVDYMESRNANIVLRGLRAVTDFEYEFQMAQVNHQISPALETLFMMTTPENGYISSSVVREIASFGGDVSSLVPDAVLGDILARAKREG